MSGGKGPVNLLMLSGWGVKNSSKSKRRKSRRNKLLFQGGIKTEKVGRTGGKAENGLRTEGGKRQGGQQKKNREVRPVLWLRVYCRGGGDPLQNHYDPMGNGFGKGGV